MRRFFGERLGGWLTVSVSAIAFLAMLGSSRTTLVAGQVYSSNVVTLTSSNWKEEVVENPHMVLVNICRKG